MATRNRHKNLSTMTADKSIFELIIFIQEISALAYSLDGGWAKFSGLRRGALKMTTIWLADCHEDSVMRRFSW